VAEIGVADPSPRRGDFIVTQNKWYEQPNGTFTHGVELPRTHVAKRGNNFTWFSTADCGDNFTSRQAAVDAAEEHVKKKLSEAVAAMGGHVVWPGNAQGEN